MSIVFLDTVGMLALWDEADQWHQGAQAAFEKLTTARHSLITTTFVLLECGNAAARRPYRTTVGATMTIYFLLAYHYALLRLSMIEKCNYPGFLILDLPAEVEGEKVEDKENFVIEPFIELHHRPSFENIQVIAAGSAFQGLTGVNRIEFTRVWKGSPAIDDRP